MSIAYQIAIDHADDGTFAQAGDDISPHVLTAHWRLGFEHPYAAMSQPSRATLTVRNHERTFSPEQRSALIGKRLRIQSDDGTTRRTHFIGAITHITVDSGDHGRRQAQLVAVGREQELAQQAIRQPLLTDVRADQAIARILAQVPFRHDHLAGYCIIGRDRIGACSLFPEAPVTTHLQTGKTRFAFLTEEAERHTAAEAIETLATAEGGRFFFDREGVAHFHHRHHLLMNNTVAATFANDLSAMSYDYGHLINHVEVMIQPHQLGNPQTLIWSLAQPLLLRAHSIVTLITPYRLGQDPVGAVDLYQPQPHEDYVAYRHGTNHTRNQQVFVRLLEQGVQAATIEIRNASDDDIDLTRLRLYGTPLIQGDGLRMTRSDHLSIALHGQSSRVIRVPAMTNLAEVEGILTWELHRHAHAHGMVHSISSNTRTHPQETLALRLFDQVRVIDQQSGHDASYHIIAEEHQLDRGGSRHRVTWRLEPSESALFFVIGTHSIGDTTVILAPR